ncbi:CC0125/CC1285 family lipoprotein [Sphingosinicella rhizophila]|uniref:DUF4136 domain-containing protein n=1 Tax=Sphingosinicella rhizophila TaxID=3050082 RepID=A0ABU3Q4I5_9SPHN|nr:hypothetical protein [Sphingosinicella sp. GR2756]MDT9598304.1 hypothetical protein [Sphingosinicella sp. GR2756]
MDRLRRLSRASATPLLAFALLTACATATPYQPLGTRGQASGGYSEQRIEDNRFRVSFTGNQFTSRQRVENYLLFRAAELTLQAGFDSFTMVERSVDPNTRTTVSRDTFGPYGPGPWGYWGPSWRYRYGGYGWRYWDPWYGSPFWANDIDVRTVTSFEATAEIVMSRGSRPNDPRSFDARQVMDNLGGTIELPR